DNQAGSSTADVSIVKNATPLAERVYAKHAEALRADPFAPFAFAPADPATRVFPPSRGCYGAANAAQSATLAVPDAPEDSSAHTCATAILNAAGVRVMRVECVVTVGVWSDLDGPEIRGALQTLGMKGLPVRYLDGAGIPVRHKLRRVEGEPVPISVLS